MYYISCRQMALDGGSMTEINERVAEHCRTRSTYTYMSIVLSNG